jgi:hypothetical protein
MKKFVFALLCSAAMFSATAKANFISRPFDTNGHWITVSGLDLELAISAPEAGGIAFKIMNNSTFACSLTHVYFDDRLALLANTAPIITCINGGQVKFVAGADPAQLPSGDKLDKPLVTSSPTKTFSADSVSPDSPDGIKKGLQIGEWVMFTYSLNSGKTFADVERALGNTDLRVGLYTKNVPTLSTVSAIIPEPATVALLALGAVAFRRRKK